MLHRGGGPSCAARLILAATVLLTMSTASRSSSFLDMVDPFQVKAGCNRHDSSANMRRRTRHVNDGDSAGLNLQLCEKRSDPARQLVPATSFLNRGLFRRGSNVGSTLSEPGVRRYGTLSSGSS